MGRDDQDGFFHLSSPPHTFIAQWILAALRSIEQSTPPIGECIERQGHDLMSCTSKVICTSSPTTMPPASSAAFQVKPKSSRLIFVVAERPMRVFPQGSLPGALGPSTAKTTGFVTT